MSHQTNLESRVASLDSQVESLTLRVSQLEQFLASGTLPATPTEQQTAAAKVKTGNRLLQLMGGSSLLPRIAALCFIMVVALGLRTIREVLGVYRQRWGFADPASYPEALQTLEQYLQLIPLPVHSVDAAESSNFKEVGWRRRSLNGGACSDQPQHIMLALLDRFQRGHPGGGIDDQGDGLTRKEWPTVGKHVNNARLGFSWQEYLVASLLRLGGVVFVVNALVEFHRCDSLATDWRQPSQM